MRPPKSTHKCKFEKGGLVVQLIGRILKFNPCSPISVNKVEHLIYLKYKIFE